MLQSTNLSFPFFKFFNLTFFCARLQQFDRRLEIKWNPNFYIVLSIFFLEELGTFQLDMKLKVKHSLVNSVLVKRNRPHSMSRLKFRLDFWICQA